MRIYLTVLVTISLWTIGDVAGSHAQGVPGVINYQGAVVDSSGTPVSGTINLAFGFYDGPDAGATALPVDATAWSETYEGVEVSSGRFSVQLGSQAPLPVALFDDRAQLWLDVTVDGETLPRVRMASVPFAQEAQSVVSGAAVRSVNGATDEVVIRQGENVTITREDNELTVSAVGPDGGLSSVAVEVPLTGEGTSETPIQLSDGAITNAKLADNAVMADNIQNETITNAKLAGNAAVLSLNGTRGDITIQGGEGAEVNSVGNTITVSVSVPEGGLTSVSTNGTLTGDGTEGSALGIAEGSVDTPQLAENAVTSAQIADGTVTGEDISNESIGTADLAGGAVQTAELADGAVTGVKLTDGALVGGSDIGINRTEDDAFEVSFTGELSDGDITGVSAGTGLTGGGDEGTVTLGIAEGGVDTPQLTDEGVTAAKFNTRNNPSSGDFLKYINGQLEWSDDLFADVTSQPSSIRWKEEVRTLENPLVLVEQLRGVRYTWTESGQADVGVIAEEVAEVLPEVVTFEDDGQARGVNYGKLVSVLIEAAKMQQQEIEALQKRVDELERLIRRHGQSSARQ